MSIAAAETINCNLTSEAMTRLLHSSRDILRSEDEADMGDDTVVNSRRHSRDEGITIDNQTGVDFYLSLMTAIHDIEFSSDALEEDDSLILLKHGESILIHPESDDGFDSVAKVVLFPSSSSVDLIGEREPIFDVPIVETGKYSFIKFPLAPKQHFAASKYSIEPTVEWCMQNQRVRSAYSNLSNIDKGMDLLSNVIWSPANRSLMRNNVEYWLHPYLDGDVYEWTDMTGALKLEKDRVMLPDNRWIWANNWTVDTPCSDIVDADGWEYAKDFKSFGLVPRFYEEGDNVRRRRWTRTRLMKPPRFDDPLRPLYVVTNYFIDKNGEKNVKLTSSFTLSNFTPHELTILGYNHSWKNDQILGCVTNTDEFVIPVQYACMTHIRLAMSFGEREDQSDDDNDSNFSLSCSNYILVIPTSPTSEQICRVCIDLDDIEARYHFTVKLKHSSGCTKIEVHPIIRVVNLLPCPLQYRLCEGVIDTRIDSRKSESLVFEEQLVDVGMESSSSVVDPTLNPFISFRVPGYRWSQMQRVVNRKSAFSSWRPSEDDEEKCFKQPECNSKGIEYATIVEFERLTYGGDPLTLILEVVPGDSPILRVYAQYWIIDKTGMGLRYCDGVGDILGYNLKTESPRRSYLLPKEMQNEPFLEDMDVEGHEFTMGKDGMTIFFSNHSKIAVSIDIGDINSHNKKYRQIQSSWSHLIDISNVIPKAVFSITEFQGERRFDLSYDVAFAPSIFSRTRVVTLYNRFHLVNLSEKAMYISQEKNNEPVLVPPSSTVPFHWDNKSLENKVRFSVDKFFWTSGTVQLDKVGTAAMRLSNVNNTPFVIQTEVKLAKKDHDSAVVVLLWLGNDGANPLYLFRNKSSYELLCNQSAEETLVGENSFLGVTGCGNIGTTTTNDSAPWNTKTFNVFDLVSNGFNCGMLEKDHNADPNDTDYFTWNLNSGTSKYFGFDDPNKSHVVEWTILQGSTKSAKAKVDVDALGSSSILSLPNGRKVGCLVRAEQSTKVIEFFDSHGDNNGVIADLKEKLLHHKFSLSEQDILPSLSSNNEDEHKSFSFNLSIAGMFVSIVENSVVEEAGREMFLVYVDKTSLRISQTRDGYHELELRLLSLQIDNHVKKSTHGVMVRESNYVSSSSSS